jgi:hypothetical protein
MNIKYNKFGYSSLLFLIPSSYASFNLRNFLMFKLLLWTIPLFSCICNSYPDNNYCEILDHINISLLSSSYLYYRNHCNLPISLILFVILELVANKKLFYSTIFSYILLNYYSFKKFTRNELIIGSFCFIIATSAFIRRNIYHKSYKIYTTLWHLGNSILLILSTNTLLRLN